MVDTLQCAPYAHAADHQECSVSRKSKASETTEATAMGYAFGVVVISILVMIALPGASIGGPLTFETIDIPNVAPTVPGDINSRGQIVGLFVASGTHGFLLSKG